MPAGLLTRFIVKIHRLIDGDCFWRSGVVVSYEDARALVVEDETNRMIRIGIEGGEAKRELLAVIRERFSEIYADFNRRIDYEELIPVRAPDAGRGSRRTRSLTTSTGPR